MRRLFLLLIFLAAPLAAWGQTCPSGTTPLPWGVTRDPTTDLRRQIFCQDRFGNIVASSLQVRVFSSIRSADTFSGADWAAKINAADADIGVDESGVIYVPSSLAGVATTTLTPSANKRIVFFGGIFSSSASPNVNINASGVTLEGTGDGSNSIPTRFLNTGTGDALVVGDGVAARRGITIEGLQIVGNVTGGDGIQLNGNLGNLTLRRLEISTPGAAGVNGNAGNYLGILLDSVRVDSAVNYAFRFDCIIPAGPVIFLNTYGNATSGATSIGYELANGQFTLAGTAADSNTRGYRLGGLVRMYGTASEVNSLYGIHVIGSGAFTISGHYSQLDGTPLFIDAAAANTVISNLRTTSTVGANSVQLTAGATGDNRIDSSANLDKLVTVAAGGVLHRFDLLIARDALAVAGSRLSLEQLLFGTSANFVRLYAGNNIAFFRNAADTNYAEVDTGALIANGNITPATGISPNSGGFKHGRTAVTDCATTGCEVTVTWGTAFGDANYTPSCSILDATAQGETTGLRLAHLRTQTAAAITVDFDNFSGATVSGTLNCVAVHD